MGSRRPTGAEPAPPSAALIDVHLGANKASIGSLKTHEVLGWSGWTASALGLLAGCAASRPPELPDPDVDLGLGDIVLLTFTTRASEGLLGHVADTVPAPGVDPHRRAIRGAPREVGNDQHLRLVARVSEQGQASAGYGPIGGGVQATRATHIAYDVRVTGYLEYTPAELLYDAESGCCLGGGVAESCGGAYVSRLFRGTGSTQLLSEVTAEVGVRAGEILRASGGKSFRRLAESSFVDSYFAYELSSLETLCDRLPPDAEFAEMKVEGARNCFLTRFDDSGQRTREAWSLPDAALCAEVASRSCSDAQGAALRCEAQYVAQKPDSSETSVVQIQVAHHPATATAGAAIAPAAIAPAALRAGAPDVPPTAAPAAAAPAPAQHAPPAAPAP
jgi:hypothetical protein